MIDHGAGLHTCPNGHPVRPSARFCPACGAGIAHPLDETTLRDASHVPVRSAPRTTTAAGGTWVRTTLITLALLVMGVGGGWAGVYLSQRDPATAQASDETTGQSAGPSTRAVSPTTSRTRAAAPTPTVPPEADGATEVGVVDVTTVVDDARADRVGWTLNEYFSGINEGTIERSVAVMDPAGAVNRDNPRHVEKFRGEVSTTTDTDIVVHWIRDDTTPGGLLAGVTFTSRQDAQYGRDGQTCTVWSLTYTFSSASEGQLLIVRSSGTSAAC